MKLTLLTLIGGLAFGQSYPSQKAAAEKAMDACRATGADKCVITVPPTVIGLRNGQPIYADEPPLTVTWERPTPPPQPRVVYSPWPRQRRY